MEKQEKAKKILIVGGVAGGATAAARLRRMDEEVEIILFERGAYLSYANCGLPYYVGGVISERDALFVSDKETIEAKYHIDVRDRTEVLSIDRAKQTVQAKNLQTGEVYEESYDTLLLSTGSSPIVPPWEGADAENIFTLWTVNDTDRITAFIEEKQPKTALVIGAGFIGLEMAENLAHKGLSVTVVEKMDQVLAPLDADMAKLIHRELIAQDVRVITGQGVTKFTDDGHTAHLEDDSTVQADIVLLSVGVRPNSQLAKDAGLALNPRGGILVDEYMQTSDPAIYAVGDVIEVKNYVDGQNTMIPLAGPANRQGRAVVDNLLHEKTTPYEGTMGTSIAQVFDLSAASTGLNEKMLARAGKTRWVDYGIALLHPMAHAAYYPAATPMTLKLVFDMQNRKVLGAQIVGYEGVDKRIDTIATVMHFHGTVDHLAKLELAYAPPYASAKEPVHFAGFMAQNILEGYSHPMTSEEFLADPDAVRVLDIREDIERTSEGLPGATDIPLTRLRENTDQLDKDATWLVYCGVGLRGYVAERILAQKGFKTRNLAGGLRSWRNATDPLDAQNDPREQDLSMGKFTQTPPAAAQTQPTPARAEKAKPVSLDACGLSCPGPIVKVAAAMKELPDGGVLTVSATDPGFSRDIQSWADNTGNTLLGVNKQKGIITAELQKGTETAPVQPNTTAAPVKEKTMIVFSGDLDKAIASFIIANGAAAMGNQVNMFFTFWGLNILRKPEPVSVSKDFMQKMFATMMPRGSKRLGLSKMNFLGAGSAMIRKTMEDQGIDSLESLIKQAIDAGVKLTACQMSMDVMGITEQELIEGVEIGGVATMLADNDNSNMNLFI